MCLAETELNTLGVLVHHFIICIIIIIIIITINHTSLDSY